MVNDRSVKAFLAVVGEGSYSAAARKLYVTQPAVTQQIRALEDELGVKLFERDGNVMRLTEAGGVACDYLQRRERLDSEMVRALAPWSARHGFTLGCPGSMIEHDNDVYSAVMRIAARHFPDTDVTSVEVSAPPDSYRVLADGTVDAVVSEVESLGEEYAGKFAWRTLMPIEHFVICARSHRFAQRAALTIADLAGEIVFVFDDVTYQQSFLDRIRASAPSNPPVLRRQPSYASALPLVEMGRGVMLYTLRMDLRDDLAAVPLDLGETHTVGMMWCRGRRERALAAFADDVARYYREIGRA